MKGGTIAAGLTLVSRPIRRSSPGRPGRAAWLRFFVVPGTQRCAGGTGPTEIEDHVIEAVAAWVEAGTAPESVLAPRVSPQKGVERIFRLCAEPKRAMLKAAGLNPAAAKNWQCRAPSR